VLEVVKVKRKKEYIQQVTLRNPDSVLEAKKGRS